MIISVIISEKNGLYKLISVLFLLIKSNTFKEFIIVLNFLQAKKK